jgi:arylformamidase
MRILDITRILSENTPVYPGDIRPAFRQEGQGWYRVSSLMLGSHTGTHIDAPSHCADYNETIDRIPIENLIGGCRVIDARSTGPLIKASFFQGKMETAQRILLKTDSSVSDRFPSEYPVLSPDAAHLLIRYGTRCIGIDTPSLEPLEGDGIIHHLLLGSGCSIVEFLDLSQVPPGDYTLVALPLRLAGLDGSPARVVLLKNGEL